eukprot:4086744-Pleurochrysis_carterae.AAC.2
MLPKCTKVVSGLHCIEADMQANRYRSYNMMNLIHCWDMYWDSRPKELPSEVFSRLLVYSSQCTGQPVYGDPYVQQRKHSSIIRGPEQPSTAHSVLLLIGVDDHQDTAAL